MIYMKEKNIDWNEIIKDARSNKDPDYVYRLIMVLCNDINVIAQGRRFFCNAFLIYFIVSLIIYYYLWGRL